MFTSYIFWRHRPLFLFFRCYRLLFCPSMLSMKVKVKSLSRVWPFATPWTVAHQAPLSMGFSRQEYWSGLPFTSPGDLPDPGIEPRDWTQVSRIPGRHSNLWATREDLKDSAYNHAHSCNLIQQRDAKQNQKKGNGTWDKFQRISSTSFQESPCSIVKQDALNSSNWLWPRVNVVYQGNLSGAQWSGFLLGLVTWHLLPGMCQNSRFPEGK